MSERPPVHIRPARESDTPEVMELTSKLWESGHDYVQEAWGGWLADSQGTLLVAEHQGRVIGLGKLTQMAEEDWWLQGLRVDAELQGREVATQMTEALVKAWREQGGGALRLATNSKRIPVHRLCERLGFKRVSEYAIYVAPATGDEEGKPWTPATTFQLLAASEAEAAAAFAGESPSVALAGGLMDLGWRWAPPRPVYLRRAIEREQAWWWRGGEGLLAVYVDQDDDEPPRPYVELAACQTERLKALLVDFRQLAAGLGFRQAAWVAARQPTILSSMHAAGFEREGEYALFVYSKS